MARLLHCDECGKQMNEENRVVSANYGGRLYLYLSTQRPHEKHGWEHTDICQLCKRRMLQGILDSPGMRF